jgi:hypothetical protein
VNLDRGVVRWIDRTAAPPRETTITPVSVRLSDLSLTTPMRVEVDAVTTDTSPRRSGCAARWARSASRRSRRTSRSSSGSRSRRRRSVIPELTVTGTVRRTPAGEPIAAVQVKAPSVHADDLELTGFECAGTERDGVATLDRLAFTVFGGAIAAKGRVDHTGDAPVVLVPGRCAASTWGRRSRRACRRWRSASRATRRRPDRVGQDRRRGDGPTLARGVGHVAIRDGRLHDVNVAEKVLTKRPGSSAS